MPRDPEAVTCRCLSIGAPRLLLAVANLPPPSTHPVVLHKAVGLLQHPGPHIVTEQGPGLVWSGVLCPQATAPCRNNIERAPAHYLQNPVPPPAPRSRSYKDKAAALARILFTHLVLLFFSFLLLPHCLHHCSFPSDTSGCVLS